MVIKLHMWNSALEMINQIYILLCNIVACLSFELFLYVGVGQMKADILYKHTWINNISFIAKTTLSSNKYNEIQNTMSLTFVQPFQHQKGMNKYICAYL